MSRVTELAEKYGITSNRNGNIEMFAGQLYSDGYNNRKSKLNILQIDDIRTRYRIGEVQTALAKEFNVSQRCISLIVREETYKCS